MQLKVRVIYSRIVKKNCFCPLAAACCGVETCVKRQFPGVLPERRCGRLLMSRWQQQQQLQHLLGELSSAEALWHWVPGEPRSGAHPQLRGDLPCEDTARSFHFPQRQGEKALDNFGQISGEPLKCLSPWNADVNIPALTFVETSRVDLGEKVPVCLTVLRGACGSSAAYQCALYKISKSVAQPTDKWTLMTALGAALLKNADMLNCSRIYI